MIRVTMRWCTLLLVLSVAACDTGGIDPTVFGTYTLQSVDGDALPSQVVSPYVLEKLVCVLGRDSTVSSRADVVDEGVPSLLIDAGSFSVAGDPEMGASITFIDLGPLDISIASATIWWDSLAFVTVAGDRYKMVRTGAPGRGIFIVDPDHSIPRIVIP